MSISPSARELASKTTAVMLAIALALMALSPVAIGNAIADDGEGAKAPSTANTDATGGKGPADPQPENEADKGEDPSSNTAESSGEKPASADPSAGDGNTEGGGEDSGGKTDKPESADEGDEASPGERGTEPSGGEGDSTPADEGDTDGKSEAAPNDAQSDDDPKTPTNDIETTPAASGSSEPESNDPQTSNANPKASEQTPAAMGKMHPKITADAKMLSKPANGKTYGAGETIKYRITVRNAGDVPLYNVRVSNLISGAISAPVVAAGGGYTVSGTTASVASLAPGKQLSIPVSYKVYAADAGASISGTATVKAVNPIDPQNPISASASTNSVKVTSISSPTAAPKAAAPPVPTTPIADVGEPIAKIDHEAQPLPNVEPQRKTPPERKADTASDGEGSWQLADLLPLIVVGALCLAVLTAAFIHKRREAAQDTAN